VNITASRRSAFKELAIYGGVAALSLVVAVWVLRLREADPHVPFSYGGDALFYDMEVETVAQGHSIFKLPRLGAPGILRTYDFPLQFECLHLLILKAMSAFSGDWALLINAYFILGFPMIALSALAVMRRFSVSPAAAATASVLYCFLPSRLLKGQGHLFLDTFFQVPLAVLIALWASGDAPPLVRKEKKRWCWFELGRPRSVAALVICAVVATSGVYYAFFSTWLILVAGIHGSRKQRSSRNIVAALAMIGVIWAVVAVEAAPTLAYQIRHGANPAVVQRAPGEAEFHGLRIAQLLLPIEGHRLGILRRLKERYNRTAPLPGESSLTSLGIVGAVAFVALLGAQLVPRRTVPANEPGSALATLNLAAVLLGTIGGFGSLFALLVSPAVRTYCRINVFIAFISLFAFALASDRVLPLLRSRFRLLVLPVVLAVGLTDQASLLAVPSYQQARSEYASDGAFVRRVEGAVPPQAMIFQLPYQPFPEATPVGRMGSYDPLRPYLHSRTLRWSFGTIRGREGDDWISAISQEPPAALVETVSAAGFAGILVDRYGYSDGGAEIEAGLRARLGAEPISDSGIGPSPPHLTFWSLAGYEAAATARLSPADRERRQRAALDRVILRWVDGFYGPERGPGGPFRWCSGVGVVEIENPAPVAQQATFAMTLFAGRPPATLYIDGDLLRREIALPRSGAPLALELRVPPGRHILYLWSEAQPASAPLDPRRLVWRIENARLETAAAAQP